MTAGSPAPTAGRGSTTAPRRARRPTRSDDRGRRRAGRRRSPTRTASVAGRRTSHAFGARPLAAFEVGYDHPPRTGDLRQGGHRDFHWQANCHPQAAGPPRPHFDDVAADLLQHVERLRQQEVVAATTSPRSPRIPPRDAATADLGVPDAGVVGHVELRRRPWPRRGQDSSPGCRSMARSPTSHQVATAPADRVTAAGGLHRRNVTAPSPSVCPDVVAGRSGPARPPGRLAERRRRDLSDAAGPSRRIGRRGRRSARPRSEPWMAGATAWPRYFDQHVQAL